MIVFKPAPVPSPSPTSPIGPVNPGPAPVAPGVSTGTTSPATARPVQVDREPTPVTPGVATGTVPPVTPSPVSVDRAPDPVTPGPGTGTNANATVTIPTASVENLVNIEIPSFGSNNVVVATTRPGGNSGAIQFNSSGSFGGDANLVFTQGGLFVGGVPTSLNASGIVTARNEYRVGVWSGFDGSSNDAWGRFRLANAFTGNTFYGFSGDPAITNPNRTVVITNEEQDVHQAMVLMDGLAYNAPSGEGTIFGVSVNQTNADYRASTGFELGWKKLIDVTNKGNVKIGGSLQITPSFQTLPPANNTVGIRFADGTFQYTAAAGGPSTIAVQEEGSNVVATASTINFVGAGVTASNVGGVATVTIPGGGGSSGITVQDEGSNVVASANTINFVGTGVTATNVGNVATVTIPSSSLVNTVYNAGSQSTVTLDYNDGSWQILELSAGTNFVTLSNIPTGGEMTIFVRTTSSSSQINWTGVLFWENNDDQPTSSIGARDIVTVKNNGQYTFGKFSKNYT